MSPLDDLDMPVSGLLFEIPRTKRKAAGGWKPRGWPQEQHRGLQGLRAWVCLMRDAIITGVEGEAAECPCVDTSAAL